ncbi:hypothetical protein ACFYXF_34675 [Streptomyces sp. NPDC002680]|uniref:hypothetical protein n=1 Tax=Streptomyces sp. NPDC002680 TaxID=3364659 RepID=UPI00368E451E
MYLVTYDTQLGALVVAPECAADLNEQTTAFIENAGFIWRPDIEAFTRPGQQDHHKTAWITLRIGQLGHDVLAAPGQHVSPPAQTV